MVRYMPLFFNYYYLATMYVLMISFRTALSVQRKNILDLLSGSIGPTLSKRGCSHCCISLDYDDKAVVNYCERWDSLESFTHHIQSLDFWNIFLAIDMCDQEPPVYCDEVINTGGLEMLKHLRTSKKNACIGVVPD